MKSTNIAKVQKILGIGRKPNIVEKCRKKYLK